MSHGFQVSLDSQVLFITVVTKNRLPVFRTDNLKAVLCTAIDEARNSASFLLFAYVIMIDHMHVLTSKPTTTSNVLRVLKGITARRVIDYLKEKAYFSSLAKLEHQKQARSHRYSLWQTEKNVFPVFSEGMLIQKVNYIHQNPVRAGFVKSATDYRWSSARIWQGCQSNDEPLLMDKDLIRWRRTRSR